MGGCVVGSWVGSNGDGRKGLGVEWINYRIGNYRPEMETRGPELETRGPELETPRPELETPRALL